jgi:glycerol kinase
MTTKREADDLAARLILKQAELVAQEVARVEVIVNSALGAAAMAMAATGITGSTEITESAKETLQVARNAAAEVLQVAKKEAELTLRLAKSLANARLAEEE